MTKVAPDPPLPQEVAEQAAAEDDENDDGAGSEESSVVSSTLSDSDDEAGGNGEASAFAKEKGNAAFGTGRYSEAAKHFTLAINLDKANHILYSNRSGAFAAMGDGTRALSDADACVKKAPNWAKGYSRRGAAYVVLGRYKDAIEAYNSGLAIEPGNAGLQKGLDDLRQSIRDGEVPKAAAPEAAAEAAPKANGMARPDLAPAPPAPAPAPAPAAQRTQHAFANVCPSWHTGSHLSSWQATLHA